MYALLGRESLELRTLTESIFFIPDVNQSAMKQVNGYDISFFPGLYRLKVVPYFTVLLDIPLSDDLFESIESLLPNNLWGVKRHLNILGFHYVKSISHLTDLDLTHINQVFPIVTDFLSLNQLKQSNACSICHLDGYDQHWFDHCVHKRVHADCLYKQLESHKPPSHQTMCIDASSNYFKSMILSMVFAFIAAIPAIISVIYWPIFYAILLFLVPLGSVLGYMIGRGLVNQPTFVLMNLTAYLVMFIMIVWAWNYYAQYNHSTLIAYLFQTDNLSPFIFDGVIGLLFVSLGLWLAKKIMPLSRT